MIPETWVIEHRSQHLPDLPPRYWSGDNDAGYWSLEQDPERAARFDSAEDAENAYRGDHRDPESCCQPTHLPPNGPRTR